MLVSIIIPMRNEEKFIAGCLDSLVQQFKNDEAFEIYCVDGASEDKTAQIVTEYASRDARVKLISNPRKITPIAMNLAIKKAAGDFIMVVGCHCEYAQDYVSSCLRVIQRTGADQVGGYMTTLPGEDTVVGRAISLATSSSFGVGNSMFRLTGPEQEVDTVPFGMYRKEVYEKIGLYDERLVRNQDMELNARLKNAGMKTIISPEIKLTYFNRSTFRGLCQQSFNNGLWTPYTIWLAGGGLRLRHFVPLFFALSLVIFLVATFIYRPIVIFLLTEISLYLFLALYFAKQVVMDKRESLLKVVWAFITIHIMYGFGSIWGIITIPFKFPNRNKKNIGKPLGDRK